MVKANDYATYQVYGYHLFTNLNFRHPLPKVNNHHQIDVTFKIVNSSPFNDNWKQYPPLFTKSLGFQAQANKSQVYKQDDFHVISIPQLADFFVTADYIYCHLQPQVDIVRIESRLLTSILSYWLELQHNNIALHASCINIEGKAVAFLADSKTGKSSIAAALVQQGHIFMTDDILRVSNNDNMYFTSPGYPALHLWPDAAKYFLGNSYTSRVSKISNLTSKLLVPLTVFENSCFNTDDVPLERIYLPTRSTNLKDDQICITDVPASTSLFKLISNCFASDSYRALDRQTDRLQNIAKLVETVVVKEIHYPDKFEHLPDVADAIVADIESMT